ncbi:MAG: class I SAM-dependent methyltransferase [Bdellovibrionia bacterium]
MMRQTIINDSSSPDTSPEWLELSDDLILSVARRRFQKTSLLGIVLRQASHEVIVSILKGVKFRQRENQKALSGYLAMSVEEFEGINARQQWANWRTIPRNLRGCVPNRALSALDLCSGTGHSTEVLAHYLPVGTKILGLEYNAKFVESARAQRYQNSQGGKALVRFNVQSVLDTFCDEMGRPIENESIDLVNCSGAVGCHFDETATFQLAQETTRVLREGGIAMMDSGYPGTSSRKLTKLIVKLGMRRIFSSRSCFADPYTQIVFWKSPWRMP